jgi:hypothetical protein
MTKDDLRLVIANTVNTVLDAPTLPDGWWWCQGQRIRAADFHELRKALWIDGKLDATRQVIQIPVKPGCAMKVYPNNLDNAPLGTIIPFAASAIRRNTYERMY